MDQEIVKGLADVLSLPTAFVIAAAWVALAWWLWERTGTPSVLMARLWQLMSGMQRKENSEVDAFVVQHNELMELRFRFFPDLRTHRQFTALRQWLDKHDEEVADVAACGRLFDVEGLSLKPKAVPSMKVQGLVFAVAVVAILLALLFGLIAWSDRVLIQVRESKNFYLVSQDRAVSLSKLSPVVAATCKNVAGNQGQPPKGDQKVLCELLSDPGLKDYLATQLPAQRGLSAISAMMLVWLGTLCFRWLGRWTAAARLAKRLQNRRRT